MNGGGMDAVLEERQGTHGSFADNASAAQELKDLMRSRAGWGRLTVVEREALDAIAAKIARVLSSPVSPVDADHLRDIAGYALLAMRDGDARRQAGRKA